MPTSKRPCCVCRRWFEPDPRLGERQRACFQDSCQRERHRRSCAKLREQDRRKERTELLNRHIPTVAAPEPQPDPARVIGTPKRDAMRAEVLVRVGKLLRLQLVGPRDTSPWRRRIERQEVKEVLPRPEETRQTPRGSSP